MHPNKLFSPNKIVVYVFLFCVIVIVLLFTFRLQQKQNSAIINVNDGTIFSASREIKPFELTSDKNEPFTQKNLFNHWTLLFFGFTHCGSVCPTTLDLLNRVYQSLHHDYPALQVVLVSLDPERDTPDALSRYVRSFNPNFIGTTGKIPELHKLQSQLGIFSARDPATPGNNYQLQHTSSVLLINPEGKWAGLFRFGLNPEKFQQAFISSVKLLARA